MLVVPTSVQDSVKISFLKHLSVFSVKEKLKAIGEGAVISNRAASQKYDVVTS